MNTRLDAFEDKMEVHRKEVEEKINNPPPLVQQLNQKKLRVDQYEKELLKALVEADYDIVGAQLRVGVPRPMREMTSRAIEDIRKN